MLFTLFTIRTSIRPAPSVLTGCTLFGKGAGDKFCDECPGIGGGGSGPEPGGGRGTFPGVGFAHFPTGTHKHCLRHM